MEPKRDVVVGRAVDTTAEKAAYFLYIFYSWTYTPLGKVFGGGGLESLWCACTDTNVS